MAKFIFLIIILTFAIYANTLHNDFVSDDLPTIVNNPEISRPFAVINIASFTNSLNYLIGGFDTFGYHLVNILLHAINSILVFFLLRLFFRPAASFWGALIFAAQPVNAEAVTWVSGRLYLLFTFFLLSSFFLYLSATSGPRIKAFKLILSAALYASALTASFFPLAYPGMLVAYDLAFDRWQRTWKFWLPFFIIAAVKLILMFSFVQERVVEVALDTGAIGWTNPLYNMVYSNFAHLWLLIWPLKLTLYQEPSIISRWALNSEIFLFALLILSLPILFRKAKPVFLAVCLYILFLAPSYSPKMIAWLVAERYVYFASIAFSIIAAFLIDKCISGSKINKIGYIFLAALILAYSVRTVIRNRDWRTHASIWRATVKVSPDSPKARNNMGDVYSLEGDLEKAAAEFRKATELKPDYAEAYHNLAFTYYKMGRVDEALLFYQQAIKFKPQLYQSQTNLGLIYLGKGQRELARYHLQEAQKFNPTDENIRALLRQMGE